MVRAVAAVCFFGPVANDFRTTPLAKDLLPLLQIPGNAGFTIWFPVKARDQGQQAGIGREYGSVSIRFLVLSKQRRVKQRQPFRTSEVTLLRGAHAAR